MILFKAVEGVSCSEGEVSGVVAVWTQDDDRDVRTESGDGLCGGNHGGDGEVLLEVRVEERTQVILQNYTHTHPSPYSYSFP